MNQRASLLQVRTKRLRCLRVVAVVVDAQRASAAVQSIDIRAGINQHACNLHRSFRRILAAHGDVEQGLLPIAPGAGRHLNIGTGLQRQPHPLCIALADEVEQRNLAHLAHLLLIDHRHGRRFRQTILLQMLHQVSSVPVPAERPAGGALRQILAAGLQEQQAHIVVEILLTQLTERHGSHHTITLPRGHGGIRIGTSLYQHAGHTHAGGGRASIHETHQQPQRRIAHITQLLPVAGAHIHRQSGLHQRLEKILICIHTGSMQRRESTGRSLGSLTRVHDFIQQLRHLALPAPLTTVNTGVLLHHLRGVNVGVIGGANISNTRSPGQQVQRGALLNTPLHRMQQRGHHQRSYGRKLPHQNATILPQNRLRRQAHSLTSGLYSCLSQYRKSMIDWEHE